MKSGGPDFDAHLSEDVTTLAYCWVIERRDGEVVALTNHDRAIVTATHRFIPGGAGRPTAIESDATAQSDSFALEAVLSQPAIDETDLIDGRFDGAWVSLFLVNWQQPDAGMLLLKHGRLGDVETSWQHFEADIRGLTSLLGEPISGVYSPECRARLGDGQCKVDLRALRYEGRVTSAVDAQNFSDTELGASVDYYSFGALIWLDGANAALEVEVASNTATAIVLAEPMPRAIEIGDRFRMTAGCDKRFETCRNKFVNQLNFRGEPTLPGIDAVQRYPGLT